MDAYFAAQIVAAERPLLAAGEPLMARAARGLATQIEAELGGKGGPILLVVGAGNNGGDALYAAAELSNWGRLVQVLPVAGRIHQGGLQAALDTGAELLAEPGAPVAELVAAVGEYAPRASVVVDGVLGTGSAGRAALRSPAREVVAALSQLRSAGQLGLVVAVDLPSGLDCDTGEVPDPAVLPADLTVTFGAYKVGQLVGEGPRLCGRLHLIDIGLGPQLSQLSPTQVG